MDEVEAIRPLLKLIFLRLIRSFVHHPMFPNSLKHHYNPPQTSRTINKLWPIQATVVNCTSIMISMPHAFYCLSLSIRDEPISCDIGQLFPDQLLETETPEWISSHECLSTLSLKLIITVINFQELTFLFSLSVVGLLAILYCWRSIISFIS